MRPSALDRVLEDRSIAPDVIASEPSTPEERFRMAAILRPDLYPALAAEIEEEERIEAEEAETESLRFLGADEASFIAKTWAAGS